MSAVLIVAVVAGVLVLGLLALGAGLLMALRSTGEAVVALEQRLADVEEQSGRVRDALSSVDGDLASMAAQLSRTRGSLADDDGAQTDESHTDDAVTSDTPMRGRSA